MKHFAKLASLLVVAAIMASSSLEARGYRPSALLFPEPAGRSDYRIEWAAIPDDAEFQNAFPQGATTNGKVQWSCRIRRNGKLTGCRVEAEWPAGKGFAVALKPLLRRYVLARQSVEAARRNRSRLILYMAAWRPNLRNADGCPVPFCVETPPPPPPPPMPTSSSKPPARR